MPIGWKRAFANFRERPFFADTTLQNAFNKDDSPPAEGIHAGPIDLKFGSNGFYIGKDGLVVYGGYTNYLPTAPLTPFPLKLPFTVVQYSKGTSRWVSGLYMIPQANLPAIGEVNWSNIGFSAYTRAGEAVGQANYNSMIDTTGSSRLFPLRIFDPSPYIAQTCEAVHVCDEHGIFGAVFHPDGTTGTVMFHLPAHDNHAMWADLPYYLRSLYVTEEHIIGTAGDLNGSILLGEFGVFDYDENDLAKAANGATASGGVVLGNGTDVLANLTKDNESDPEQVTLPSGEYIVVDLTGDSTDRPVLYVDIVTDDACRSQNDDATRSANHLQVEFQTAFGEGIGQWSTPIVVGDHPFSGAMYPTILQTNGSLWYLDWPLTRYNSVDDVPDHHDYGITYTGWTNRARRIVYPSIKKALFLNADDYPAFKSIRITNAGSSDIVIHKVKVEMQPGQASLATARPATEYPAIGKINGNSGTLTFTIDDSEFDAAYPNNEQKNFTIEIVDGATTPNTFQWSNDDEATWNGPVSVSTAPIVLSDGVSIAFSSATGGVAGDKWHFSVGMPRSGEVIPVGMTPMGTAGDVMRIHVRNTSDGTITSCKALIMDRDHPDIDTIIFCPDVDSNTNVPDQGTPGDAALTNWYGTMAGSIDGGALRWKQQDASDPNGVELIGATVGQRPGPGQDIFFYVRTTLDGSPNLTKMYRTRWKFKVVIE